MGASPNRRARRVALWLLYAIDVSDEPADAALRACRATLDDVEGDIDPLWVEIEERVVGVAARRTEIDEAITALSPRWKLARMAAVDRNILRLGIWEILHGSVAPIAVINGCVDLGKEYGEKGTSAFINGLLDQFCKDRKIAVR